MSAWSGVAVAAVALVVVLVAVGQPTWEWHRSSGSDYETWSYRLFDARHTVHNGTAGTTVVSDFAYADLPGQPEIVSLFVLLQDAFLGMAAAAVAAAALSLAAARRRWRGLFAALALLAGCVVGLAIPLLLVLDLPAAAGADLPPLNGQPVTGFEGQMTLPQAGTSPILVLWGPAVAWYLLLILAVVLAFGASEMWSVKPAKEPTGRPAAPEQRPRAPPPPEPPAPPRQEPILEEVFVIGSNGLLIKHMSRTLMSEKDRDVVGGMISILSNFVREAFSERNGTNVQEITLGDHRFILCNDSGIVVAVLATRGATEDIVPRLRHLIALLVDRYGEALENWGGEPLDGIEDEIAVLWQPFFLPPPPAD